MSGVTQELQRRIVEAATGHRVGSTAARHAVRDALSVAYVDGLLTEAPEWLSDLHVHVQLVDAGECCMQFQLVH